MLVNIRHISRYLFMLDGRKLAWFDARGSVGHFVFGILSRAVVCLLGLWGLAGGCHSIEAQPPPAAANKPEGLPATGPLDGRDGRELSVRNFRPQPQLKTSPTLLTSAKFPVVDIHTHFRRRTRHSPQQLDDYVSLMDRNQIAVCVSLDGQLGAAFEEHKTYLWKRYPDRFVIFANIDWRGQGRPESPETWDCHRPSFGRRMANELAKAKAAGASGLKIFKDFGLRLKNPDGSLVKIDDPRWDPIWAACGELGLPIIIHTADPAAFFLPIDENNERWEELSRHPDWSFYGEQFPSRQELLEARNRIIKRHPRTVFFGAHMANNPEDLAEVERWLQQMPNLYVEFSSRIAELGRQPYTARKFFLKHADRVLFGTDGPWPETRIRFYWRFVETLDENFPYSEKVPPPQGLWNIHGLGLPDEVLRKLYFQNAARLIPGVADRVKKFREANSHNDATKQRRGEKQ